MANQQNSYTGSQGTGTNNADFSFTFPSFTTSEVKVEVDNVVKTLTTHYTVENYNTTSGGKVRFTAGNIPTGTTPVRIFRQTDVDSAKAIFTAGSSLKAAEINDNFKQVRHALQEAIGAATTDRKVQRFNIEADSIDGTLIADDVIDSEHLVHEAIDTMHIGNSQVTTQKIADGNVTTAKIAFENVTSDKLAANAITQAKIADNAVVTANIVDANVTTAKIANSAITTAKIADSNVTTAKIAADAVTNAKIADNSIDSEHYVDGSIDHVHLSNDAVDGDNIADNSINSEHYVDGSIDTVHLANNAITGVKIASDAVIGSKIAADSIDSVHYAAGSVDTQAIDSNAVTTAKIADNNVTTAKLADNSATNAKVANNAVTQAKIATSAVTSSKIADLAVETAKLGNNAVTTAKISSAQVTDAKLASNSVTTSKITDANVTTVKIADSNVTLAKLAGDLKQTTISNSDTQLPTSGAVVDYVAAQIAPLGGLEVIATDAAFPNAQPQAGVVISIADAGGLVVNGSGTSTTGRTVGGSTVTINNINSQFNNTTVDNGVAMMVSSTGSGQIYNYHKATLKEADLLSLSGDINDFAERYRVSNSAPTSSLDEGDLWWDSATDKLKVYDGSSWEEVASSGDFYINTISSYSGTGGNSATFDGTAYRFVLSNPGSSAQQHVVSINGVIQKPNSGTSQPSEGFVIDGSSIIFSNPPASGSDYFILTLGTTVSIGTPSNGTVTAAKIASSAVTTAKIADGAITGAKIATNLDLPDNNKIRLGTGNDLQLWHNGSTGNSNISNINGDFYLQGNNGSGTAVNQIAIKSNAAVELNYQGTKKLETTNTGAAVDGILSVPDAGGLYVGTGNDLQIYHNGTDTYLDNHVGTFYLRGNTGTIQLRPKDDEWALVASPNGAVELAYDGVKKLETYASGVAVMDSVKYAAGNSADLEIYHNGTGSYLDNSTGPLYLRGGTNTIQLNPKNDEWAIVAAPNGAVEIAFDGIKKFETTSGGAQVNGSLGIVGNTNINSGSSGGHLTIMGGATYPGGAIKFTGGTASENNHIKFYGGTQTSLEERMVLTRTGELGLGTSNPSERLHVNNSATFTGLKITSTNNSTRAMLEMSGRDSSGVPVQLKMGGFGDTTRGEIFTVSNHALGFATNNAAAQMILDTSGNLNIPNDSGKIRLGTSQDLLIYHDGGHSFIHQDGTGSLKILADTFRLNNEANTENIIAGNANGAVELYYDNAKKLHTRADGIEVTGVVSASDHIYLPDNKKLRLGNNPDLEIYHDGSHTYANNTTGFFHIRSGSAIRLQKSDGEPMVYAIPDGAVELYYDQSKRLETKANGITMHVTGTEGVLITGATSSNETLHLQNTTSGGLCQMGMQTQDSDGLHHRSYIRSWKDGGNYSGILQFVTRGKGLATGGLLLSSHDNKATFEYNVLPYNNNAYTLGNSSKRWHTVYSNSSLNTSDKNFKNSIQDSDLGLSFINKLRPVSYKWNQKEEEIADTKTHYGFIAQEVETAIKSESKTLDDYAGVFKPDNYKEDGSGDAMAIAIAEIVSPLVKAVQELSTEVETLKTKVAALEAK